MKRINALWLCSAALTAASPAWGQQTPDAANGAANGNEASSAYGMNDIIVTAQKRETNLQRTAIAMSAVSGDALRDQQVGGIDGLAQSLPSVNFGQTTGNARIAIRGVGFDNISVGNEGRVAYHVDGVYVSRPSAALASFYDIERVEVLRGPQGTLYGRNATGGAINVVLAGPTDSLDGFVEASYGNYDLRKLEGAVGGPLSDAISARLSFSLVERDGYGKNLTTGIDVDDQSTRAVRGQVRIHPSDAVDIRLAADYFHQDDHAYGFHFIRPGSIPAAATGSTPALPGATPKGLRLGGVVPTNLRDSTSDFGPFNNREFWNLTASANFDLGGVDLTSVTGYRNAKFRTITDLDATSAALSVYDQLERSKTFSQELRLSGDFARGEWMIGGFYFHESLFGGTRVPLDPAAFGSNDPSVALPPLTDIMQGLTLIGEQRTRAFAGFASLKYELADALSIRVGARYSREKKSVDELNVNNMAAPYPPLIDKLVPAPPGRRQPNSEIWSSFTPSLTLEYQATSDLFLYATYAKGFKSGGFNLGNLQAPFAPEKITDYEAGLRADWLDGRLRTNLSGFYYDYKNLQVSQVVGAAVLIQNAASAVLYGMEAEVSARPVDGLNLSGNLSLLHSEYKDFVSADPARAGLGPINLAGNKLTQSPKYTLNLSADYTVRSAIGDFNLRGETRFVGKTYFTQYNLDHTAQPSYSLFNAFLNWKGENGLTAGAFIRNIGNKRIISSALVGSGLVGFPFVGTFEPPRTYGVTLGYQF
jgi:iron complex outermembrane receptor protein